MVVNCAKCPERIESLADEDLARLAVDGNEIAFQVLFQRHASTYFRLAMSVLKSQCDADDAVQNAGLNIYRKLHTYTGEGPYAAWSYRIAMNSALMLLRKRKSRRETDIVAVSGNVVEAARPEPTGTNPHRELARKEVRERVAAALQQMAPKYRRAIELREFEGLTMVEMSEVLELSVGGVKTRLHRARALLQAWLEGEFDITLDHVA